MPTVGSGKIIYYTNTIFNQATQRISYTYIVRIFNDKLFLWIISSKQLNFGLAVFNLVAFPVQVSVKEKIKFSPEFSFRVLASAQDVHDLSQTTQESNVSGLCQSCGLYAAACFCFSCCVGSFLIEYGGHKLNSEHKQAVRHLTHSLKKFCNSKFIRFFLKSIISTFNTHPQLVLNKNQWKLSRYFTISTSKILLSAQSQCFRLVCYNFSQYYVQLM